MALPNDMSRIADGIAGADASKTYTATAKKAARNMIRESFTLSKTAADGAASTATAYTAGPQIAVPRACRILGAKIVPAGAATADATNNAVITVSKGDGAGGAAVTMATYTSDVAGGSLAAGVIKAMTVTSTLANTRIPAGGVLGFTITKGGTGVVVPVLSITVDLEWEDVDGYGA